MIRNVLQSDAAEARDLFDAAAVLRVFELAFVDRGADARDSSAMAGLENNVFAPQRPDVPHGAGGRGRQFRSFSWAYFSVLRENSKWPLTSTPANVVIAGGKLRDPHDARLFRADHPDRHDTRIARQASARGG